VQRPHGDIFRVIKSIFIEKGVWFFFFFFFSQNIKPTRIQRWYI